MRWIGKRAVLAIHQRQVLEHGGAGGVRDEALLESALARPKNLWEYEHAPLPRLTAAYAYGIIRNHPFVDGNKRVGLVVAATFLLLNGRELVAPEPETASVILAVADGSMDEATLARWLGDSLR